MEAEKKSRADLCLRDRVYCRGACRLNIAGLVGIPSPGWQWQFKLFQAGKWVIGTYFTWFMYRFPVLARVKASRFAWRQKGRKNLTLQAKLRDAAGLAARISSFHRPFTRHRESSSGWNPLHSPAESLFIQFSLNARPGKLLIPMAVFGSQISEVGFDGIGRLWLDLPFTSQ
jgi:hypothetical protein